MKALKVIVIVIIIVVFLWGLINIIREKITLQVKMEKFQAQLNSLTKENKNLLSRIEYLQNPENLLLLLQKKLTEKRLLL